MNKIQNLQAQKVSTSHTLHAIMTIIFIPWVVVWIMMYLINRQTNRNIDIAIAQCSDDTETDQ